MKRFRASRTASVASLFDRVRDVATSRGDVSGKGVAVGTDRCRSSRRRRRGRRKARSGNAAEAQTAGEADVKTPPARGQQRTLRETSPGPERKDREPAAVARRTRSRCVNTDPFTLRAAKLPAVGT